MALRSREGSQFEAGCRLAPGFTASPARLPFEPPCCHYSDKFHDGVRTMEIKGTGDRRQCQTAESVMHAGGALIVLLPAVSADQDGLKPPSPQRPIGSASRIGLLLLLFFKFFF